MKAADLKLTFDCNNRCVFCVQGDKRHEFPARPLSRIRAELAEAYACGARAAVFTGGEPTLHEALVPAVAAAKEIGYRRLHIQTNGRMFCYEPFCLRLLAAGARHFTISLHGATAKTHDALTRAPGSFAQSAQGVRNLKKLGAVVSVNTVIARDNVRALPAIARLLVKLGADGFQFAFPHILGSAAENASAVVPPIKLAARYAMKGLAVGLEAGKTVTVEAIPACLLPGFEKYRAETLRQEAFVFDSGFKLPRSSYNRICEGKALGPRCNRCRYRNACEGPWKEYPKLFGWDEFTPVE